MRRTESPCMVPYLQARERGRESEGRLISKLVHAPCMSGDSHEALRPLLIGIAGM